MYIPPPAMQEAQIKIREQELKRDFNPSWGEDSNNAQKKRLSRRAFVLIQLTIMVLLVVGLVLFYHFVF